MIKTIITNYYFSWLANYGFAVAMNYPNSDRQNKEVLELKMKYFFLCLHYLEFKTLAINFEFNEGENV
ncbi:MAG: hypothetical protein HC939_14390 [Pleurocapsa sp. SU_5_0]|nr:hypothetical protein [Pleurocapsa sp. SU_5_0]NJO97864.1 hypothetical protein [Pleurocapsa sp. CRU_1_2]